MLSDDKISQIFNKETHIFKDQDVFDIHVHPKNFLYRENQLHVIANNIRPALKGYSPIHTVLLGDFATGKTTAIKRVFEIAKMENTNVIPVYINCKVYSNRFKIYSMIHEAIFNKKAPSRGSSSLILFDKIMKELKNKGKILLIAFDDVNYLLKDAKCQQMFYELVRAYEVHEVRIGVFPILTSLEFRYKFDADVKTTFIPEEIIFPPYNSTETYGILKDRCCEGFADGVINHEIIERVCDIVTQTNNLRLGLTILRTLGNKAEIEGTDKITNKQFSNVIKTLNK